jgi:hypothetical protein
MICSKSNYLIKQSTLGSTPTVLVGSGWQTDRKTRTPGGPPSPASCQLSRRGSNSLLPSSIVHGRHSQGHGHYATYVGSGWQTDRKTITPGGTSTSPASCELVGRGSNSLLPPSIVHGRHSQGHGTSSVISTPTVEEGAPVSQLASRAAQQESLFLPPRKSEENTTPPGVASPALLKMKATLNTLKSSTMLSHHQPPSTTIRVSGMQHFFVCRSNPVTGDDIWSRHVVKDRRVPPGDGMFSGCHDLFCISCPNRQKMNNGGRGHCVMVLSDFRWRLFAVWRLEATYIHGYNLVTSTTNGIKLNEDVLPLNNETKVIFVSVYGFQTEDEASDPRDLVFLNPIDGCWNVGVCPTTIWLPLPAMQVTCTKEGSIQTLPRSKPSTTFILYPISLPKVGTTKKRKRGTKHRGGSLRRKIKTKFANYPSWLQIPPDLDVPTLTIYIKKSDINQCPLSNLANEKKKGDHLYLLPKLTEVCSCSPFKKGNLFHPVEFYLVSKPEIASLNGLCPDAIAKLLINNQTVQQRDGLLQISFRRQKRGILPFRRNTNPF